MVDWGHNRGVTLVEMLVVLGIILVLASLVVTVTWRVENQSQENALRNAFALLSSALREYYDFKGQFPAQAERNAANALAHMESMYQELRAVPAARVVLEKVSSALVKSADTAADVRYLCDPWGTVMDYVYAPEDTFPELISAGPDKQFGTGDDINSKGRR